MVTGVQTCALPISVVAVSLDRKSTRLNSSHHFISYAVFCLKKKKKTHRDTTDHILRSPECTRDSTRVHFCGGTSTLQQSVKHACLPPVAVCFFFFFLMIRRPRRSTLFPYPTLFR